MAENSAVSRAKK